MGLNNILKKWDGFNKAQVNAVLKSENPLVTIVMLSWRRHDRLRVTLSHLKKTLRMPVNICLRVQECNNKNLQKQIREWLTPFHSHDVMFTKENEGTGVPRHERLHTALDKFDTPFILFTDDDMKIPRFGIELLTSILLDKPEFGAANMVTAPRSFCWGYDGKGRLAHKPPKKTFEDDTISLGSSTLVVRREVFETCDLDNQYYIGCADIDFGLQMTKAGWKMGMLALPDYKATNWKGGDHKYGKTRYNKKIIAKSRERFLKKWNLEI